MLSVLLEYPPIVHHSNICLPYLVSFRYVALDPLPQFGCKTQKDNVTISLCQGFFFEWGGGGVVLKDFGPYSPFSFYLKLNTDDICCLCTKNSDSASLKVVYIFHY